jgi:pyrroloquinoline quinone (PQQ) biosynthesis protein C
MEEMRQEEMQRIIRHEMQDNGLTWEEALKVLAEILGIRPEDKKPQE